MWVRDHGQMQDWVALQIHIVNRRTALAVDAVVGVRADPVERLLAQILGGRTRRRAPTWVRRLAHLHEGTPGVRDAGGPWHFDSGQIPDRVVADFATAFEQTALPFLQRMNTLDALAAEMSSGGVGGEEAAWRLPLLHLLRGDAVAAREVLEHGTRWMAQRGSAEAYRTFALEVVRRLGDATLVETPCEELVSVLRPALVAAFPDRASPILAAVVRSFWWEAHPRSGDAAHCSFCGTTEIEATLFGETLRICDTCVAACDVMLVHPLATGASRWLLVGPTRVRAPEPRGVTAEGFATDAVRALRPLDDASRFVGAVERRLLTAPADRPPESVCVACGPLRPPRSLQYDYRCSFCRRYLHDEASVDAGRAGICEECVNGFLPDVAADRRLA